MTDMIPLDSGTTIGGHYIIDGLINRGGFGAVYRGIDSSEGDRLCAIKETYDVSPTARRRALMEAAVLFTVKSKHLPRVYDAFEADGRFYLVMQLIEGKTLQQLLKLQGRPCSEQEVVNWLVPIMHVLNELHSRNPAVIHRDIKPGNIILTPDQTAVLVDFGLTKLYDPNSDTQTLVRAVSGGYSPVEQYVGRTSPQSDIYAMAATMYFLLTLKLPPESVNRSYRDELIAPRLLNPMLSPNLEHVLLKAMSVNADQRYRSMDEFAQALQNPSFTQYADPTIANGGPGVSYTQRAISRFNRGLRALIGRVCHSLHQPLLLHINMCVLNLPHMLHYLFYLPTQIRSQRNRYQNIVLYQAQSARAVYGDWFKVCWLLLLC